LKSIKSIKSLKARYGRALEQRDWDTWAACFTEDATAKFHPGPGEKDGQQHHGRAALRSWVPTGLNGLVVTMEVMAPEIEICDPHHATCTWSLVEHLYVQEGPIQEMVLYGYSHETYSRNHKGLWEISSLKMTLMRQDTMARTGNATTVDIKSTNHKSRGA
jgi:hypothetical protein